MDTISRREALSRIFRAIVAVGASSFVSFSDLLAAEARLEKPVDVVWLHGLSCSGCSTSLLNVEQVSVVDIITRFAHIVFHPDISLATGGQVTGLLEQVATAGRPFVLVVEGGIPTGLPHACMVGERPFAEWVDLLAPKAGTCIAVGTCSALGGITTMTGMERVGSRPLGKYLAGRHIATPVVNLPNCPLKPEHFVYTLLHLTQLGHPPALDQSHRPQKFFGETVHDKCIYYADFQKKRFAGAIGQPGCLLKLGCQGPVTRNDCLITGHNGNTNVCIRAGHPCIGCASEHFPRKILFHTAGDARRIARDATT